MPGCRSLFQMKATLALARYNCVVVELERSLSSTFSKLEQKALLTKMRAFIKIKAVRSTRQELTIAHVDKIISEKLLKVFNRKLLNLRATGFYTLLSQAIKNKKMRKYDLAELDSNEPADEDTRAKLRELEGLTSKYHRLISEFNLLNAKVANHLKQ